MISKNLSRRLERLEESVIPLTERKVWQIVILNSDGTRQNGRTITWQRRVPTRETQTSRNRYR
jgi:hypothetical protein